MLYDPIFSDLGSQAFSTFPDGVFIELGHLRDHHIPAPTNLSALLESRNLCVTVQVVIEVVIEFIEPTPLHHNYDVTENKIRQVLPAILE